MAFQAKQRGLIMCTQLSLKTTFFTFIQISSFFVEGSVVFTILKSHSFFRNSPRLPSINAGDSELFWKRLTPAGYWVRSVPQSPSSITLCFPMLRNIYPEQPFVVSRTAFHRILLASFCMSSILQGCSGERYSWSRASEMQSCIIS